MIFSHKFKYFISKAKGANNLTTTLALIDSLKSSCYLFEKQGA